MSLIIKIKIFLILLLLCYFYWLAFICSYNINSKDELAITILVHFTAFFVSLSYFRFLKIPYISVLSALNILGLAIAPANVDFTKFQLGILNPEILDLLNSGYLLFYVSHFLFLEQQIKRNKKTVVIDKNISKHEGFKQLKLLQNYTIFFYLLGKLVELPISGLNEFIELIAIGSLVIGFFMGLNSTFKNILTVSLLLLTFAQILVTSLIYPLLFFGIFILSIIFLYGLNTIISKLFISFGLVFFIVFSILFNPVKMLYREIDFTGKNIFDRLSIIQELIVSEQEILQDELKEDQTFFWRLTYPMSAVSMVYEKTPSKVPYWEGESYWNLVYKFIPRFIWNSKPKEEMGQLFGHRYEILDKWDLTTSMNTPILAEAYMNYGYFGFYGIFLLMSFIMARAFITSNLKVQLYKNSLKTLLSGLNVAIVLTFLIQWESNFSMIFGKIIILYVVNFIIEWLAFRKQDDQSQIYHLKLLSTKQYL